MVDSSHNEAGRLIIQHSPTPIEPNCGLDKLELTGCGAVVSFVGRVREEATEGRGEVEFLEFDIREETWVKTVTTLAKEVIDTHQIHSVAITHRSGRVEVGEVIIVIHVGTPHRKAAFAACSDLIDGVKFESPIWKKEGRTDGSRWVEGKRNP